MHRLVALAVVAALAVCAPAALAQQAPKEADLKTEVPALTAMHEVIMPLWHEAWPAKDTAAMATMWPAIEKHVKAVTQAELPGILRDKSSAWRDGVAALNRSATAYQVAIDTKEDAALLKAAEALHRDYEALVKVVRPILKEMDDFHASLYVLYHYQLNPLDMKGAVESVTAMRTKIAALNAAVLPDRLKAKQEAFTAQRARLSAALDALVAAIGGDRTRIAESVEKLHIEYEKLERVF